MSLKKTSASSQNNFILSFDLPRDYNTARVRIFRHLKKINARMVHESFWRHDDLKELVDVAMLIKKFDGSASILEERLVF